MFKCFMRENCFTKFQSSIEKYKLPERFNFPFYYDPHPLSILAAEELQCYLKTNPKEWKHNFGLEKDREGLPIGKMFGVLVVQNQAGEIGYLSAFSGKLGESNHHKGFVPPVFDILTEGSFFNVGIVEVNKINQQIKELKQAPDYLACLKLVADNKLLSAKEIKEAKVKQKADKVIRKSRRIEAKVILSNEDYQQLEIDFAKESQVTNIQLKRLIRNWKTQLVKDEEILSQFTEKIEALKLERSNKSAGLQQRIFRQYQFLNQAGERKDLLEIFTDKDKPPIAGSGECAAPKLLQYAFLNQMEPITMAEFWWGKAPNSEIRKHKGFYPACRGKCQPILGHMLSDTKMDENPFLQNTALGKELTTVYEDDAIVIINKPPEFLSVPGKNVQDSVQMRMQIKYPNATGPMVVHRLDMSTSGLMVIAKTSEAHKYIQYQFIKRRVKKRYVALLDGIVEQEEGIINLPLRVDLEDRPRQLVCYEHGKKGVTKWKVVERSDNKTRIHFFPITGRTHQLRVHSAHSLGLNTPIIGDDLYGTKVDRLHLHAAFIEFTHPVTKEIVQFEVEPAF
jgi:tRNA pseudouridine32 synthase/23S rRNA pseudouridine746 synthase